MFCHHFHIPVKGVAKKTLFHFSDSHLIGYDEQSTEEEKAFAEKQILAWKAVRKDFGVAYDEPYSELGYFEQYTELIREANKADAAVLTGDTVDYISGANLRLMEQGLSALTVPFAAVCGNHENAAELPDGMRLSVMKRPIYSVDLGDLLIVALDNGQRNITAGQLASLKELLNLGKPVIVAMHIPIMTPGNREALLKCGEYFQFNYDGCPQENCDCIDLLTAKGSPVIAVLTGHLHFSCVSEIANGVMQYGASQAIGGHCNIYTVGE